MTDEKRCSETTTSGRCRLHQGHDGAHQYMSSRSWRDRRSATDCFQVGSGGGESTTTLRYDDEGYPVPTTPAELAEQARLNSLHRARRTIVLEIDALHADQEDDRARALQAALDSIDHVFRMMLINARSFQ